MIEKLWRRLLEPPSFDDPDDARVARLVQAIALTMLVATAAMSVNNLLAGQTFATVSMAVAALVSAVVLALLRLRLLRIAAALIPAVFLMFLIFNVVDSHGLHDVGMVGFPAVVVLAGLLVGPRALFAYSLVTIGALVGVYALEVRGFVPEAVVGSTDLSDIVNISVILLITTILLQLLVRNLYRSLQQARQSRSELQQLIGELETKNAELERFAYTVSHDLKTPLVTINNFLGYLVPSAEKGDIEGLRRDVERVTAAARSMGGLLDDLLELSRIGFVVRHTGEAPFAELAEQALVRVAGPLEARGVEVAVAPGLPPVSGDVERLVEVLQLLIENAVRFMGDQARPRIEIGARAELETVFFVRDNGIGIEPRYHERVFGLFDRLDPAGEGSGVGLAIARRIVEAHHGRIWVESRGANTGATFCFTVPLRDGA